MCRTSGYLRRWRRCIRYGTGATTDYELSGVMGQGADGCRYQSNAEDGIHEAMKGGLFNGDGVAGNDDSTCDAQTSGD